MKALLLVSILFSFNSFAGELGEAKTPEKCEFSDQSVKRETKDLPKSPEDKNQEVKSDTARA